MRADMLLAVMAVVWAAGCDGARKDACVADEVGTLRAAKPPTGCQGSDCVGLCNRASAEACFEHALALTGAGSKREAEGYFRRACGLGLAMACSGYGALMLSGPHTTLGQRECAGRIFHMACAARDQTACGFYGSWLLESRGVPDDTSRRLAREHLEHSCDELRGAPCRVLASHLEKGTLGEHDPATIVALLARACDGGDRDGCASAASRKPEPPKKQACLADVAGTLRLTLPETGCRGDDCVARCRGGDPAACYEHALALQEHEHGITDELVALFRRGCELGLAPACTNAAAAVWAQPHDDDEGTCARRTFERACAVREHYACGMVGRMLIGSGAPPERVRAHLERSCDELRGFPCRVLALYLEEGSAGTHDRKHVRALLQRACKGGDPPACGSPKTAAETFD
jgi:TPR repeat protein